MTDRPPIAQYRHLTSLQKPETTGADSFNTINESDDAKWDTVAHRRAHIQPAGGREFFSGQQLQADVTHIVRYRQDSETEQIDPTYRIKFGTRYLNVVRAYSVDERGREIEVQAIEKVK